MSFPPAHPFQAIFAAFAGLGRSLTGSSKPRDGVITLLEQFDKHPCCGNMIVITSTMKSNLYFGEFFGDSFQYQKVPQVLTKAADKERMTRPTRPGTEELGLTILPFRGKLFLPATQR